MSVGPDSAVFRSPIREAALPTAATPERHSAAPTGLLDALAGDDDLRTYSIPAMALLSRAIEETFEHGEASGTLLVSFQRLSLALPTLSRYRAIASHADVIHLWAHADVEPPPNLPRNLVIHALPADHPITRTWFLVAIGTNFTSALLAEEVIGEAGAARRFHGGWTNNHHSVARALDWLAVSADLPDLRLIIGTSPAAEQCYLDHVVWKIHRRLLQSLDESAMTQRVIALDSTRRFQLERELRIEGDRLRNLQRLLSDTTVHDFRNSLTLTVGCLELLLREGVEALSAPQRQLAEMALAGGVQASALAQTLLDVARSEAGAFTIAPVPLTRDAVDRLIDAAVVPGRVLGQGISVRIDESVPMVVADGELLSRVLGNLLDNAARYGGTTRTMVDVTSSATTVSMSVRDFGPGVPPSMRDLVFDAFVRAVDDDAPRGTGLGLAFCRLVAEAHGGSITLESPEDGGARFTVTIPIEQTVPLSTMQSVS
jgi:signal transduction histidine kinase